MKIEQIYTGCLAQGAYYIRSENEAAIIDPLREVAPYLAKAAADGVTIQYVLETHFHADFVSGHVDLAARTGARIVYGPTAQPGFAAHIATDGEIFRIGKVTLQVLHTPGHTMESTTFLLRDEAGEPHAIFTGDTLFLGDVGRPDLAQKAAHLTSEQLAGLLYDSLRNKIMPLPDHLLVYPAHGAGSACGKHMMTETVDTLGHQRQTNYALRADMTREEFIQEVLDGLTPPPAYFPDNVRLNKQGYTSFDQVLHRGLRPLTPSEFELLADETGAVVLDTRDATRFAQGFIPNAINIGIDGSFAPWVGALIPGVDHPILIVADPGREDEVITRLARVGFDRVIGFLKGGIAAWQQDGRALDNVAQVTPAQLEALYNSTPVHLVDVRKRAEFDAEHLEMAHHVSLDTLNDHLAEIPKHQPVYIHCAGGYRSMIACSILKARGWEQVVDVQGGFKALADTSLPRTAYSCPNTGR